MRHMAAASMTVPMASWINSYCTAHAQGKAKGRSMVVVWLSGGPPTIDMWDIKVGSPNQGEFQPIQTTGDGMICEHYQRVAKVMKHLNVIRSYNSREASHERGTYLNHTAYPPIASVTHPAMGAVSANFNGSTTSAIPGFISLGGPGVSPGFLGASLAPFRVNAGPNPIPNLDSPLGAERFARRRQLFEKAEGAFLAQRTGTLPEDHKTIYEKTFSLMNSTELDAFKIELEEENTRERYGDSTFGKNMLMTRRLIEIGVPFIEVGLGGFDLHANTHATLKGTDMMPGLIPQLDNGIASLVEDLVERGMWSTTTLVVLGEFGRTPRINPGAGRDHWGRSWQILLGGGSMPGGRFVGATDQHGVDIVDREVEVSNLFASLYKANGIDPTTVLRSPNGRPIPLVGIFGDGKVVEELF